LSTRRQRWRVALGGQPAGGITISDGAVFVGSRDGFASRIDLQSGRRSWRVSAGGPVVGALAVDGGRVFCTAEDTSSGDSFLKAFDATSGRALWNFSTARYATGISAPALAGGLVYAGFGDGFVRAFDVASGEVRWQRRAGGPALLGRSPHLAAPDVRRSDRRVGSGGGPPPGAVSGGGRRPAGLRSRRWGAPDQPYLADEATAGRGVAPLRHRRRGPGRCAAGHGTTRAPPTFPALRPRGRRSCCRRPRHLM